MIFLFFHDVDPSIMTSLTARKSQHYVVVMESMLFESAVCERIVQWMSYSLLCRDSLRVPPGLEDAGMEVKGKIYELLLGAKKQKMVTTMSD